jgi:hypothetical protein
MCSYLEQLEADFSCCLLTNPQWSNIVCEPVITDVESTGWVGSGRVQIFVSSGGSGQ